MSNPAAAAVDAAVTADRRHSIIRDAVAVGVAVAAYGLSFGALAVASGFSVAQAATLSAFAFTGASQFAYIGVLGGGGTAASAISVALLLGARNGLYAAGLTPLMAWRGWKRIAGAQLTIDESTAMATARQSPAEGRLAFWATGISVFVLWNLSTLLGAFAGGRVGSPERWGLDVAFPAAFLALLAPQLRGRRAVVTAGVAVLVTLALVPLAPVGVPVLVAAATVVPIALWGRTR